MQLLTFHLVYATMETVFSNAELDLIFHENGDLQPATCSTQVNSAASLTQTCCVPVILPRSYLFTDYTCKSLSFELSRVAQYWAIMCCNESVLASNRQLVISLCDSHSIWCLSHLSAVNIKEISGEWSFDSTKQLHRKLFSFVMWLSVKLVLEQNSMSSWDLLMCYFPVSLSALFGRICQISSREINFYHVSLTA